MKFEYPYTLVGIDHVNHYAKLKFVGATPVIKEQISDSVYEDIVTPLDVEIEIPVAMIYVGNPHHRVIKSEYKDLVGSPVLITIQAMPNDEKIKEDKKS